MLVLKLEKILGRNYTLKSWVLKQEHTINVVGLKGVLEAKQQEYISSKNKTVAASKNKTVARTKMNSRIEGEDEDEDEH